MIMRQNPYIDEIDELVEKVLSRIEYEIPWSGDFAPVYESFQNKDEATKRVAGLFRLRVYKMPADVVPDPEKRYIEAAVYHVSGSYKATGIVGSGNKDEIISIMKSDSFREKLYDAYVILLDVFNDL